MPGQQSPVPYDDADDAVRNYSSKLKDKLSGGYRVVEMNYEDEKEDNKEKQSKKEKVDNIPQP